MASSNKQEPSSSNSRPSSVKELERTANARGAPPSDAPAEDQAELEQSTASLRSAPTSRGSSPVRQDRQLDTLSKEAITRRAAQASAPAAPLTAPQPSTTTIARLPASGTAPSLLTGPPNGTEGSERRGSAPAESTQLRWPVPPRIKSPPPAPTSKRNSHPANSQDNSTEGGNGSKSNKEQRTSPDHSPRSASFSGQGAKNNSRAFTSIASALETVEEDLLSTSPPPTLSRAASRMTSSGELQPPSSDAASQESKPADSETRSIDSGKQPSVAETGLHHPTPQRKPAITALTPAKIRPTNEGPSKHMTVETETVPSIPQTTNNTASGSGKREESGVMVTRPSSDTIRPKRERRKRSKKTPSIKSGTTSTKADKFEAKVASAVDEDSSDSEETFVYESNPPETRPRHHRHHSRTPSGQSLANDKRAASRVQESTKVKGKRSMKFASSTFGSDDEDTSFANGSENQNHLNDSNWHHFGFQARSSPAKQDSPYSQATKARRSTPPRQGQRSPRGPHRHGTPSTNSTNAKDKPTYDFDSDRADDEGERRPLLGTVRTPRRGGPRRSHGSNLRYVDYYDEESRRWSGCGVAGCTVLIVLILVVILGAVGFVFAMVRPLDHVRVVTIQDVLASEQELMLSMVVEAMNPNLVPVTVSDMDVNIFARSKQVASPHEYSRTSLFLRRATGLEWPPWSYGDDSRDDGTDPIEKDPKTMLLGRILHFDSPVVFEASPLRHQRVNSTGDIRLAKPGNKTEAGGSARWEHVLEEPFEIIVRGILKYQLPMSSRTTSVSVGGSVLVDPDDDPGGIKDPGNGNATSTAKRP